MSVSNYLFSRLNFKTKENHIGRKFSQKSINVWSLIRPCCLEKTIKINTRVDTLIRATIEYVHIQITEKADATFWF